MIARSSALHAQSLAHMGGGKFAYVRPIKSDQVAGLFPGAPNLPPGLNLYALISADGSPIMVTDTREAAIANAWQHDLEMVSVH